MKDPWKAPKTARAWKGEKQRGPKPRLDQVKVKPRPAMKHSSPEYQALQREAEHLLFTWRANERARRAYVQTLMFTYPDLAVVDAALLADSVGFKIDIQLVEDQRKQNAEEAKK